MITAEHRHVRSHSHAAASPEGSPTVCVFGGGAGVNSAWEQEKLEARKILENAVCGASPPSTARFVGRFSDKAGSNIPTS
jgi:hypothetical protein